MEHDEVKARTVRSIFALIARTVLMQVVTAVSFFLLGIYLSPSIIGAFIVVSSVMRIFTLFTDVGLGAALVQKTGEVTKDDLALAFTVQEILVITVVIIGLLLSPFVGHFLALQADGLFLYKVLVFSLFISSLKVIPSVLLERKLAFEKQIIPQVVESVIFNILVVVLAYKGLGLASYSWAVLASSLAGLPLYYLISPWPISLTTSLRQGKHLLSYGLAYQGKTVLAVIKDDLLTLFLSRLVGASGIGYWGWAQRWAYSPYRFVVDSVTKVTFPAYSRFQNNLETLGNSIEQTLYLVSAVLFPTLIVLAVTMTNLTLLVPNLAKWHPALLSFYLLCLQSALAALSNILINVLDSTGRVKITLNFMLLWIVLTWGLSLLLIHFFGFNGIAAAQVLVAFTLILVVYQVQKIVPFDFVRSIKTPFLASLPALLAAVFFFRLLPVSIPTALAEMLFPTLIYVASFWLWDHDKVRGHLKYLRQLYKKAL